MRLVAVGVVLVLFGFATLLAMTIRALSPQLFLALAAFAALFGGTLLALLGLAQRHRQ